MTAIETALLKLLSPQEIASGAELSRRFRASTGRTIDPATTARAMRHLHEAGLVKSWEVDAGGKLHRLYEGIKHE